MELALKIASKIRANERFAVYIVIQMQPEGHHFTEKILFWQVMCTILQPINYNEISSKNNNKNNYKEITDNKKKLLCKCLKLLCRFSAKVKGIKKVKEKLRYSSLNTIH